MATEEDKVLSTTDLEAESEFSGFGPEDIATFCEAEIMKPQKQKTIDKKIKIDHLHVRNDQGPEHKMNSVHVICDVTDVGHLGVYFHKYLRDMKQKQSLRTQEKGMMHSQKGFISGEDFVFEHDLCNTIRVFLGTPKLNRQDMNMFFYKCIQEADGCGVSSVTFLVPEIVRRLKLFASTLISCVKKFTKETPSSSIKRIYIRITRFNAEFQNTKQIFEEIWAKTSGEESPDSLSQQIDEPQEEHGGKQDYPSEDIYLKKKLSIMKLTEKPKEGSEHLSQEDVIFEKEWAKTSGGKQKYPSTALLLKKKLSIMKLPEKSKEASEHVSQEDDRLPQRPHESSK